jgi:hypothetical protein
MKVNLLGQVYIVKWKHPLFKITLPKTNETVEVRGTECSIKDMNSGIYGLGTAVCSKKEQFAKDRGRKISLARAFKSQGVFKKPDRKVFWDEYLSLKK